MKVAINDAEWYPVMDIVKDAADRKHLPRVDVPAELVHEYDRALAAFEAICAKIEAITEPQFEALREIERAKARVNPFLIRRYKVPADLNAKIAEVLFGG